MGEQYELLPRRSQDSDVSSHSSFNDYQRSASIQTRILKIWHFLRPFLRPPSRPNRVFYTKVHRQAGSRRRVLRYLCPLFATTTLLTFVFIIFTYLFRPSYTHLPDHYRALQERCAESQKPGRGNINSEKVFIAATLYDPAGTILSGEWGRAVLGLVDLLGPENVHLSVYENDASPPAKTALKSLEKKLECNSSLLSDHLPLNELHPVTAPSGESRVKRIAFLAEARNRALRPLEGNSTVQFDKLLYLNDVIFDPGDAINLLFSTNYQSSGRTQYRAACAVDFINAFKFYDRFATRDAEGYTTGIPFYPWFTDAGRAESRQDVLDQKDAVRVQSCWGGMTAFEAKWFQHRYPKLSSPTSTRDNNFGFDVSPLRFRYEEDTFWDASECCLVHADLTYLSRAGDMTTDSGIYMNPYVRVAYDSRTLGWLPYTRRVERLYSIVHNVLNHVVGMPEANPRRLENPGDEVKEKVWTAGKQTSSGQTGRGESSSTPRSFHEEKRIAGPGRFCGTRKLLVLKESSKEGEKNWENLPLPPGI